MNNYKYFEQDGEKYHLKAQFVFLAFLGGIFLIGGLVLAFTIGATDKANRWVGYIMAVLGALVFLRVTAKTTIDMQSRQVLVKRNFLSAEVAYSLDNFETFLVARTVSLFGITMNGTASMILNIGGKEKNLMLNQSVFTVAPLNHMVNEALQIMKIED
ncbi:hypothetical protein TH53_22210 [Pedobacter lusitanus]|uniref:DUF304 domain-containing protein n=1 Tax=Pedobacter lusitanus TaxID=1503925 RepID=A0A0D0GL05_9SPHI|nr:hypothetical protein [Pedobacter lusitanus]KIO75136.1 hypothetical protein TH53_22210 [Pedobacter lusitanus]